MKKITALLFAVLFSITTFANYSSGPGPKGSDIFIKINDSGKTISLLELSKISKKDFEIKSGSKLNLFTSIQFKLTQKRLRKYLKEDKIINTGQPENYDMGFHLGGFALGFLLGPVGIIIAYLMKDERKKQRVKWSWIGFGTYLGVGLLVGLIVIFSQLKK